MEMSVISYIRSVVVGAMSLLFLIPVFSITGLAEERTILVTVFAHNDRTRRIADRLEATDFAVLEDKRSQKIIDARKVGDEPVTFAVLIQDNLVLRVNNELRGLRQFIRDLPAGSRVMTGYITFASLNVRKSFTDKESAAKSLRIISGSAFSTPFSPYLQVTQALRRFDRRENGRRMALVISDGLDDTFGLRRSSPFYSLYLDRAISEAQRRGVAVFTIYAPATGTSRLFRHAINYGQGSLWRLADQTGGESFFSGSDFVTFHPYLKEYRELLKNQWLITYRSQSTKRGFRRVEVTTDFDIHLHHPAGYRGSKP